MGHTLLKPGKSLSKYFKITLNELFLPPQTEKNFLKFRWEIIQGRQYPWK